MIKESLISLGSFSSQQIGGFPLNVLMVVNKDMGGISQAIPALFANIYPLTQM